MDKLKRYRLGKDGLAGVKSSSLSILEFSDSQFWGFYHSLKWIFSSESSSKASGRSVVQTVAYDTITIQASCSVEHVQKNI